MPFETRGKVRFIPDQAKPPQNGIHMDSRWKSSEKRLSVEPNTLVTVPRSIHDTIFFLVTGNQFANIVPAQFV